MPLHKGIPYEVEHQEVADDEMVFIIEVTGEIVKTYDEYVQMKGEYEARSWTDAYTGTDNLTYQEAVNSEVNSRKILQPVPADLHPGLLAIVHHSNLGMKELANKMADALYPAGNTMHVDSAAGRTSVSTIAAQHEKLTAASLRAFIMQTCKYDESCLTWCARPHIAHKYQLAPLTPDLMKKFKKRGQSDDFYTSKPQVVAPAPPTIAPTPPPVAAAPPPTAKPRGGAKGGRKPKAGTPSDAVAPAPPPPPLGTTVAPPPPGAALAPPPPLGPLAPPPPPLNGLAPKGDAPDAAASQGTPLGAKQQNKASEKVEVDNDKENNNKRKRKKVQIESDANEAEIDAAIATPVAAAGADAAEKPKRKRKKKEDNGTGEAAGEPTSATKPSKSSKSTKSTPGGDAGHASKTPNTGSSKQRSHKPKPGETTAPPTRTLQEEDKRLEGDTLKSWAYKALRALPESDAPAGLSLPDIVAKIVAAGWRTDWDENAKKQLRRNLGSDDVFCRVSNPPHLKYGLRAAAGVVPVAPPASDHAAGDDADGHAVEAAATPKAGKDKTPAAAAAGEATGRTRGGGGASGSSSRTPVAPKSEAMLALEKEVNEKQAKATQAKKDLQKQQHELDRIKNSIPKIESAIQQHHEQQKHGGSDATAASAAGADKAAADATAMDVDQPASDAAAATDDKPAAASGSTMKTPGSERAAAAKLAKEEKALAEAKAKVEPLEEAIKKLSAAKEEADKAHREAVENLRLERARVLKEEKEKSRQLKKEAAAKEREEAKAAAAEERKKEAERRAAEREKEKEARKAEGAVIKRGPIDDLEWLAMQQDKAKETGAPAPAADVVLPLIGSKTPIATASHTNTASRDAPPAPVKAEDEDINNDKTTTTTGDAQGMNVDTPAPVLPPATESEALPYELAPLGSWDVASSVMFAADFITNFHKVLGLKATSAADLAGLVLSACTVDDTTPEAHKSWHLRALAGSRTDSCAALANIYTSLVKIVVEDIPEGERMRLDDRWVAVLEHAGLGCWCEVLRRSYLWQSAGISGDTQYSGSTSLGLTSEQHTALVKLSVVDVDALSLEQHAALLRLLVDEALQTEAVREVLANRQESCADTLSSLRAELAETRAELRDILDQEKEEKKKRAEGKAARAEQEKAKKEAEKAKADKSTAKKSTAKDKAGSKAATPAPEDKINQAADKNDDKASVKIEQGTDNKESKEKDTDGAGSGDKDGDQAPPAKRPRKSSGGNAAATEQQQDTNNSTKGKDDNSKAADTKPGGGGGSGKVSKSHGDEDDDEDDEPIELPEHLREYKGDPNDEKAKKKFEAAQRKELLELERERDKKREKRRVELEKRARKKQQLQDELDRLSEKYEAEQEKATVRPTVLGLDRNFRRYWWGVAGIKGVVLVESPPPCDALPQGPAHQRQHTAAAASSSSLGAMMEAAAVGHKPTLAAVITTADQLDALVDSLDAKGVREHDLKKTLERLQGSIEAGMRKAQAAAEKLEKQALAAIAAAGEEGGAAAAAVARIRSLRGHNEAPIARELPARSTRFQGTMDGTGKLAFQHAKEEASKAATRDSSRAVSEEPGAGGGGGGGGGIAAQYGEPFQGLALAAATACLARVATAAAGAKVPAPGGGWKSYATRLKQLSAGDVDPDWQHEAEQQPDNEDDQQQQHPAQEQQEGAGGQSKDLATHGQQAAAAAAVVPDWYKSKMHDMAPVLKQLTLRMQEVEHLIASATGEWNLHQQLRSNKALAGLVGGQQGGGKEDGEGEGEEGSQGTGQDDMEVDEGPSSEQKHGRTPRKGHNRSNNNNNGSSSNHNHTSSSSPTHGDHLHDDSPEKVIEDDEEVDPETDAIPKTRRPQCLWYTVSEREAWVRNVNAASTCARLAYCCAVLEDLAIGALENVKKAASKAGAATAITAAEKDKDVVKDADKKVKEAAGKDVSKKAQAAAGGRASGRVTRQQGSDAPPPFKGRKTNNSAAAAARLGTSSDDNSDDDHDDDDDEHDVEEDNKRKGSDSDDHNASSSDHDEDDGPSSSEHDDDNDSDYGAGKKKSSTGNKQITGNKRTRGGVASKQKTATRSGRKASNKKTAKNKPPPARRRTRSDDDDDDEEDDENGASSEDSEHSESDASDSEADKAKKRKASTAKKSSNSKKRAKAAESEDDDGDQDDDDDDDDGGSDERESEDDDDDSDVDLDSEEDHRGSRRSARVQKEEGKKIVPRLTRAGYAKLEDSFKPGTKDKKGAGKGKEGKGSSKVQKKSSSVHDSKKRRR